MLTRVRESTGQTTSQRRTNNSTVNICIKGHPYITSLNNLDFVNQLKLSGIGKYNMGKIGRPNPSTHENDDLIYKRSRTGQTFAYQTRRMYFRMYAQELIDYTNMFISQRILLRSYKVSIQILEFYTLLSQLYFSESDIANYLCTSL